MTDRSSELTRVTSVRRITAPNVVTVVLENLVIQYKAPEIILTENGKQFPSKCFAALCNSPKRSKVTTIEYRPQTNGQVKNGNRSLVVKLWHYFDKVQQNWDMSVHLLFYVNSTQMHRTTGTTPFSLKLSRNPLGASMFTVEDPSVKL